MRATVVQLALGRLRRAAAGVDRALQMVAQARRRPRALVIESDTVDRLGRNRIAREIDRAWARRLLLQFLGGHDLVGQVRRALPADWLRHDSHGDEVGYFHEWELLLGPFWCGPVVLTLTANGRVQLKVTDGQEPPWWHRDASEEEMAALDKGAGQRMMETGEVVLGALLQHWLELRTEDDHVADVAAGPVFVGRTHRRPDR